MTSMPSMPSVPLMRASPSLAASSTGVSPAAASASAAGTSAPEASRTVPSPISASAQCASGARSPEQPSKPYSCTTGVMPCEIVGEQLRGLAADAGVTGRQRREPQQHQRPDHLALHLGAGARGVRATSDRWSWARMSVGMCRVASAPNPVEMPYAGVGAAASSFDHRAGARVDRGQGSVVVRRRCPCLAGADGRDVLGADAPTSTVTGAGLVAVDMAFHPDGPGVQPRPSRYRRRVFGLLGGSTPSMSSGGLAARTSRSSAQTNRGLPIVRSLDRQPVDGAAEGRRPPALGDARGRAP